MNLSELGKDLVVRAEAALVESNLDSFKAQAETILDGIRTNLVSDDDYIRAKEDAKACQEVETRIGQAHQDITMGLADVSDALTTLSMISDRFRNKRLTLEKQIRAEVEARKTRAIDNVVEKYLARVHSSPVKKWFSEDVGSVRMAAKGKRTEESITAACQEEVTVKLTELRKLEAWRNSNMDAIKNAQNEFPGLFPDAEALSIKDPEIVQETLKFRIEKHKNDLRAKEERQEKLQLEREALQEEDAFVPPPPPTMPSFEPPPPPVPDRLHITVEIVTDGIDREALLDAIGRIPGVVEVR